MEEENNVEAANPDSPGKWLLKCMMGDGGD